MPFARHKFTLLRTVAQPQAPEDETKGVEMEADFEGALHDVPEDPAADDAESDEGDDERLQQVLDMLHICN
jgi:hypothetical protein